MEPLLRFPCHIYNFDKFVRKIIITIPFFTIHRDESVQYKMHPVKDEMRETGAHLWKLLASFPIHLDGRYYIDYISIPTWWKIGNAVDGGGGF